MSGPYTVHVGGRDDEWPAHLGAAATRAAARELAKQLLGRPGMHALGAVKAQVRLRCALLDQYTLRPTGSVRHVYTAHQRERQQVAS